MSHVVNCFLPVALWLAGAVVFSQNDGPDRLAMDIRILGIDGKPIDQPSSVTIWEQLTGASEAGPRDYTARDPRDGTVWRRLSGSIAGERGPTRNGKDRFLTDERLKPGVYRVTAFIGARNEKMHGMAVSDLIRLDGSQKTTPVSISVEQGPAVTFTVLDAETNAPIQYPTPGIELRRADGFEVEWDPLNPNLFPGEEGRFEIEHLPPGTYRVNISARTYAYGYPDYEMAEPAAVEIRDGGPNAFTFQVIPKPIDPQEAAKRWPWAVEGTVTDGQERPLAGVEIRAACGWGTLRPTMPVFTDPGGRYLLRFGPGMMVKNEKTGTWGAGVQAATISARKAGYAEKNLGRQGDLLMADQVPEDDSQWDRDTIILPQKPYRVDFTMVPSATIKGKLLDEGGNPLDEKQIHLTGDVLPPSSSVAAVAMTDADGRFLIEQATPGFLRWFEMGDAKEFATPRTQSFTLKEDAAHEMVLQITSSKETGKMLRIASIRDSQGQGVLDKVLGDDPRARPFVDSDTTAKAREVLDRAAEANRYWFRALSQDVKSFSYTFHLAGSEPRKITYKDYTEATSWYREWYPKGISYTGAARVLISLREKARFREVKIGDDEISLYFVLQGLPSTVAAGNGLSGTWSGFFNTRMEEGVAKIDAERLTPISVQFGNREELYTDYVEIEPDRYVPGRIQILSPGMDFDFRFRVYRPNLWLFDRSFGRWTKGEDEPVAWITDVTVNGEPAVPGGNPKPGTAER